MSLGDLLFAGTEWLRSTPLSEIALGIAATSPSLWIGTHFWVIPIIQTLHILALAAAFGAVLMINLRILGLSGQSRTFTQTLRRFQPWVWWAVLVLAVSGIGMVVGEPPRTLINAVFWLKLGLVLLLVLFSYWYQAAVWRHIAQWDGTLRVSAGFRIGAALLIILWCIVMLAGRWIAYAPV
ncbi:MAG TPA: DUF6644 family protein [Sphingobium sp.]|nr:DUF6644 family protein [Sphingobium sp.]